MTSKELRRLSRRDLLEMLISQTRELNQLRQELGEAHEALNTRQILLSNSGSIAEAALQLNKVFEAAQAAADQYLESIRRNSEEDSLMPLLTTSLLSGEEQEILEQVRQECAAMRAQTEAECQAMRDAAQKDCESMIAAAKKFAAAQQTTI